jgi:hypothetical protein
MSEYYIISNYCSIRNHEVVLQGQSVYSDTGSGFQEFLTGIYQHYTVSYPKFYKMDNLSKLGFLTAELLLRNKNIHQQYAGNEVGIILMNTSSSLETDRHHQSMILDRNDYFPSPAVFVYTLPNIVIGEISIRHKFTGEGTFFVQEKFNPSFLVNYVKELLDQGIIQCCIAGWVETEGNDYESVMYLIEKTDRPNSGIANFEPASIQRIYDKEK